MFSHLKRLMSLSRKNELMKLCTFDSQSVKRVVRRTDLENQIKRHIEGYQENPVSIFWSPLSSGKTTLFKNIITDYNSSVLQQEREEEKEREESNVYDPMLYPVSRVSMIHQKKPQISKKIKMISDISENNNPHDIIKTIMDYQVVEQIISERDQYEYVFVIDDFDALCSAYVHDSMYISAKLDALSSHAHRNKFKIILLSSNPLIAVNASTIDHNSYLGPITNMTKDVINQGTDIRWGDLIADLITHDHNRCMGMCPEQILRLSKIASHPEFTKILAGQNLAFKYDNKYLERMAESYANLWKIGIDLLTK